MTVPFAEGRQPQASLFDIWAEAIRWEQEGMPENGKPLCAFCSWCSVWGPEEASHLGSGHSAQSSELAEFKEIQKCQQYQLNQLT